MLSSSTLVWLLSQHFHFPKLFFHHSVFFYSVIVNICPLALISIPVHVFFYPFTQLPSGLSYVHLLYTFLLTLLTLHLIHYSLGFFPNLLFSLRLRLH